MTVYHEYDDIINMPNHKSQKHPHMSMLERAAQFSPFAAMTGLDDAVDEVGRITQTRIELDENSKDILDMKLCEVVHMMNDKKGRVRVSVEYFVPDAKKMGGSYESYTGNVKKIDDYERVLVFEDGKRIGIEGIVDVIV